MKEYKTRFTITLKEPILTSETALNKLKVTPTSGYIKSIEATPIISSSLIKNISIEAIYSSTDISHLCESWGEPPAPDPTKGIIVITENGYLLPPFEIASTLIMPLLNIISGVTLQADIYSDMRENLHELVSDFIWILPDGREVPSSSSSNYYPRFMYPRHPDLAGQPLSANDWALIQGTYNGSYEIPLWRTILANAIREQRNDIRNTIIQCATALDVGITPFLQSKISAGVVDKFDMRVLNGSYGAAVRTPDLRAIDSDLYDTLKQLWYTRHAIVHKGDSNIYDRNPITGVNPLRPIQVFQDIPEFIRAVPKGIKFIETHQP